MSKRKPKKQTKPETILTGITEPTPDNKPELKAIDIRCDLFFVRDISECIDLLRISLPYWYKNQKKYPAETALVEQSIYYYLVALSAKCETMLPPVPRSIDLILDWTLFVEIYLLEQIERKPLPYQRQYQLSQESHAIGLFRDDKGLSVEEIAKIVGCSNSTAYAMKDLRFAREIYRKYAKQSRVNIKPKALKSPHTGKFEVSKDQDTGETELIVQS